MNSLANAERLLRRYQAHTIPVWERDSDIPSDAEIEYSDTFLPGRAAALKAASPLAAAAAAVPTSLSLSHSTTSEASSMDVAPPFPRGWAATAARSNQAAAAAAAAQPTRQEIPTGSSNDNPSAASESSAPYQAPPQSPPSAPTPWSVATTSAAPDPDPPQLAAALPEAVQRQLEDAAAATESLFRMLSSPLDDMLSAQSSRLEGQDEQQVEEEWHAREGRHMGREQHTEALQRQRNGDEQQQQQQQQPALGQEGEVLAAWPQQHAYIRALPEAALQMGANVGASQMEDQQRSPKGTGSTGSSSPSSLSEAMQSGPRTAGWPAVELKQQAERRAAATCSAAAVGPSDSAAAGGAATAAATVEAGVQTGSTLDQAVQAGGSACTCCDLLGGAPQHWQCQQQQQQVTGRGGCGTACCRAMSVHCCIPAGACHSCRADVPCEHCQNQLGGRRPTLRVSVPTHRHGTALEYGAGPPQQLSQQQPAAAGGLLHALNQAAAWHAEQGARRAELFARVQPLWWSRGAVLQQAQENEAARRKLGELVRRLQAVQAREAGVQEG